MPRLRALLTALLAASLVAPPFADARQKPSRRRALAVDNDMKDIPEPKRYRDAQFYDFFDATFFQQPRQTFDLTRWNGPRPAYNVNSEDQVPDSSWFTNRNARRLMSLDEIRRGPNNGGGPPETRGPWTIIGRKESGITPGFRMKDAAGEVWFIKFDSLENPELATGAEMVSTKLYYASGYNTTENYIVRFDPAIVQIAPDATIVDSTGFECAMAPADVTEMMKQVPKLADGRVRAMASRLLAGKPKGPFKYHGRRKDDPNDWIPHEHRRELRGLRVVASWLNDNDIRERNTLDMYVTENGKRFLRHYLIDYGSSLGSDTLFPNIDRAGFEYIFDGGEIGKSAMSLGLYQPPWLGNRPVRYASVGNFEAGTFRPERWKPNYPIMAFDNLTAVDAYWGARIVLSFTDAQIRAAVESAEYSDKAAAEYLVQTLIERRERIGRHWLQLAGGLDHFRMVTGTNGEMAMQFDDLTVQRGYAEPAERIYRHRVRNGKKAGPWHEFKAAGNLDGVVSLKPGSVAFPSWEQVIEVQVRNAPESRWSPGVAVTAGVDAGEARIFGWVRAES